MQLTANFTLQDLIASDTAREQGLENLPPAEAIDNLRRLAQGLEEIQGLLAAPLDISSAYRSAAVNAAVGGTATSHHLQGWAADVACPAYGPPLEVALAIGASPIAFDTVILEYGRWVHVSFEPGARRRLLSIYGDEGYHEGLWDPGGVRRA